MGLLAAAARKKPAGWVHASSRLPEAIGPDVGPDPSVRQAPLVGDLHGDVPDTVSYGRHQELLGNAAAQPDKCLK